MPDPQRAAPSPAAEIPLDRRCPACPSGIVAVDPLRRHTTGRPLPPSPPHPESARKEDALVTALPAVSAAALEAAIVRRIGQPRYQLWFAPHTRFHVSA